jgi:hypothetical protein
MSKGKLKEVIVFLQTNNNIKTMCLDQRFNIKGELKAIMFSPMNINETFPGRSGITFLQRDIGNKIICYLS